MGLSSKQIEITYPLLTDCFAMEKQINVLRQDMNYYYSRMNDGDGNKLKALLKRREELFATSGCKNVVLQKLETENKSILDKYSQVAKTRIESDSISTRNIYIGVSVVTLISAALIIYKYSK